MRPWLLAAQVVLLGCSAVAAPRGDENWPKTVAQAVEVLESELDAESIEWIRRNSEDNVAVSLHLPFGTGVRNDFGLWGRNRELLDSCGTSDAEECSSHIFHALWKAVRATTAPDLAAALDCQFELLEHITIRTSGFYAMRIGEVLGSVQEQIDRQLGTAGRSCADGLVLAAEGSPDLTCWTRYEFEEPASLEEFLGWFSWRNGATVAHYPPEVRLRFAERCSWPEQPTWFKPERRDA